MQCPECGEYLDTGSGGGGGTIFVLILLIAYLWFWGGKYEGMKAEEWADEAYTVEDTLLEYQSCVEDTFPNMSDYCSTGY